MSAVITAFLIPANMLLQQDISQASFAVLAQMSVQLSSLTVASQFINSTAPAFNVTSQAFQPAVSSRWINSLWFLSLILTLTSAVLHQGTLFCSGVGPPLRSAREYWEHV